MACNEDHTFPTDLLVICCKGFVLYGADKSACDDEFLGVDEKQKDKKRPVVKEVYDEVIFWEPADEFYNRVKHTRVKKAVDTIEPLLPVYREQQELNHLLAARNYIAQQRANMVDQLEAQGL